MERQASVRGNAVPVLSKNRLAEHSQRPDTVTAPPYSVLFLDVRGVLYDSAWPHWLHHLIGLMGVEMPMAEFLDSLRRFERLAQAPGESSATNSTAANSTEADRDWELLGRYLASLGLTPNQVEEIQAAGRRRYRECEQCARPLPGVPSALARLSAANCWLGALCSQFTTAQLRRKLAQLELQGWFQITLSIADLQREDSNSDPFRRAARRAGHSVSRVAYVSRNAGALQRAHLAGMATIAYDAPLEARASHRITRIDQLLPSACHLARAA